MARTFKIATYNVNSIRSRLPLVIDWLKKEKPHVLCMQETKVPDDQFPREAFQGLGYRVIFKGTKGGSGVAIASLEEPQQVSFGLDGEEVLDEDRLICCMVSGIWIVNTYVPQGQSPDSPMFAYKLKWYDKLLDFFRRRFSPEDPLIWCGDLNVAPEPIDVHNPKRLMGHVCFRPEVWEKFERMKEWGLVDLFRLHHPGEPGHYTFFDYRVPKALERGLGWRVDHILATRSLAQRCKGCWIDLEPRKAPKPSDHTPLVAEFDLPEG
ncbi:MAG: exodeoxyribonuclease III [Deltaproteobacteria bacterium]|nr:MAG: exodeoxyribonuclease III [Deltaproteobacteria bacterium]